MATAKLADGMKLKAFYTAKELAERWGSSERSVMRESQAGRLRRTYIRGMIRYAADEVARYEAEATAGSPFTLHPEMSQPKTAK